VRGRRGLGILLGGACAVLFAAGCGGGSKQTAGEPEHTYLLEVPVIDFLPEQAVSRPAEMKIEVVNEGTGTAPDVAITVDSFYYTNTFPELSANKRPIWIVEQGPGTPPRAPVQSQAISPPGGGQTAYVNTWALGPLAPGKSKVFVWKVVPVKSGTHRLHLKILAGLGGNAKATLPNGGELTATFESHIKPAPPATHVNPSTGKVEPGRFPKSP
jgi:hypothetical protein